MANKSLEDIIIDSSKDKAKTGIFNNASQHWNHNLFWKCMKPSGGGKIPPKLEKRIVDDLGSVEQFKKDFIQAGTTQFGSGWCWLVKRNGKLKIVTTRNQDNPLMNIGGCGDSPILGIDVWEHAYYKKFGPGRGDYVDAWWNVVNWAVVEDRFNSASQ